MTPVQVSVVIVSRGRPAALTRCLTAIGQLRFAPLEVVVVSDAPGLAAVGQLPLAEHIKRISCEAANISVARNLGIEAAAGEIVAFIDDDAVPEPDWLSHLVRAFETLSVDAAGGYVRGRNGLSWQWRASAVDRQGISHPVVAPDHTSFVPHLADDLAVKTEGTNMAFRRSVLSGLGGFDENFRYFLDETDLDLRLHHARHRTAIVPRAVVHHGFDESTMRRKDRAPRDLTEIGASWAVFLHKHARENLQGRWEEIEAAERRRALRHMVAGRLEPHDVTRLLKGLKEGFAKGLARPVRAAVPLKEPDQPFLLFPTDPNCQTVHLSGRIWSATGLRKQAAQAARAGQVPDLYLLSPTSLYHRRVYQSDGYWEQSGGLFGKSLRDDRIFQLWSFQKRIKREIGLWSFDR